MKITFLLFATLTVFLAACESDSNPVAVDPAPDPAGLQVQAVTRTRELVPVTFAVKQVSRGSGQLIGWCDEAAGVVRTTAPGIGTGSHIGRFEIDQAMCVNTVTGAVTDGAGTVTAANGDELYFAFEGQALPGLTLPVYDLFYTFAGGTGRFTSADGEIQAHVVYTSPSTWKATSNGWLRYAASDRSDR